MGSSTGPGTEQVCCQEERTRGCKAVSGNHGWRPQTPRSTALAWEAQLTSVGFRVRRPDPSSRPCLCGLGGDVLERGLNVDSVSVLLPPASMSLLTKTLPGPQGLHLPSGAICLGARGLLYSHFFQASVHTDTVFLQSL